MNVLKYSRPKASAPGIAGRSSAKRGSMSALASDIYLPRVEFDDMFERVDTGVDSDGNAIWHIRAKAGLVSPWSSSPEAAPGTAGEGGRSYLRELLDVSVEEAPGSGTVLTWTGQAWEAKALQAGLDTAELAAWLTEHNYVRRSELPSLAEYATRAWVKEGYQPKGDYLTEHQDISHLLTRAEYEAMWEWVTAADGTRHIQGKAGVVSPWHSSPGAAPGTPGVGGSTTLAGLGDVGLSALGAGQVLGWDGERWTNVAASATGLDESQLAAYLSAHGYVTQSALGGYVSKAGDTMTGTLRVNNIESADGNGLISYHPTSWTGVSSAQWGAGALNSQGVIRSSNASLIHYRNGAGNSTIWDSGNDGPGSELDADTVDGVHADGIVRNSEVTWNNGESVVDWAKRIGGANPTIYNETGWSWGAAKTLTLDSYSIDSQRYSAIDFKRGHMGGTWQTKGILFVPHYQDSKMIYLAQMTRDGASNGLQVRRYADYDTVLASNVASATRLQGTYSLWGNSFYGNDVTGTITSYQSIPLAARTSAGTTDWLHYYDGNHYYIIPASAKGSTTLSSYRPLCLRNDGWVGLAGWALVAKDGGNVGIGYNTYTPAIYHKLDVNGSAAVRGCLHVVPTGSAYDQGIRIYRQSGNWATITFCAPDQPAVTGTSANTWFMGVDGSHNLWLNRNASNTATAYSLCCNGSGHWGFGTASPECKVDVAGTVRSNNRFVSSASGSMDVSGYNCNDGTVNASFSINPSTGGAYLWVATAHALRFATSNTERARFTAGGDLLIGATSNASGARLHVAGVIHATTGIWTDGYFSGKGNAGSSDARLKANPEPLTLSLRDIAGAPLVAFDWRDGSGRDMGSIAQYWQGRCPLAVHKDARGYLSLDYGKLATAMGITLGRVVQGHGVRLDDHEARIKKIEKIIAA